MHFKLTNFSPFEQIISSMQKGVSNHDHRPFVTFRWQRGLMTLMTAFLLMIVGVNGVKGQTNYVSWDFTDNMSQADYASNQTNQNAVRTTDLTSATFGGITLASVTAAQGNTFHF
jgi:hypothetical protein